MEGLYKQQAVSGTSACRALQQRGARAELTLHVVPSLTSEIKPDLEGASVATEVGQTVLVPWSLGTPPGCGWQTLQVSQQDCAHGCRRQTPVWVSAVRWKVVSPGRQHGQGWSVCVERVFVLAASA